MSLTPPVYSRKKGSSSEEEIFGCSCSDTNTWTCETQLLVRLDHSSTSFLSPNCFYFYQYGLTYPSLLLQSRTPLLSSQAIIIIQTVSIPETFLCKLNFIRQSYLKRMCSSYAPEFKSFSLFRSTFTVSPMFQYFMKGRCQGINVV